MGSRVNQSINQVNDNPIEFHVAVDIPGIKEGAGNPFMKHIFEGKKDILYITFFSSAGCSAPLFPASGGTLVQRKDYRSSSTVVRLTAGTPQCV